MSFLRHQRSFRPMGKEQTGSRLAAHSRLSSARMSRSRLFLGGSVSTGARFPFTGCGQNAVQWSCRSSNLQRTANSVLFGCLSRGVHPSRWDYRVTIRFKNSTVATTANPDEEALIRQLWPDQETYNREERRRFEILVSHWDLPVTDITPKKQ